MYKHYKITVETNIGMFIFEAQTSYIRLWNDEQPYRARYERREEQSVKRNAK